MAKDTLPADEAAPGAERAKIAMRAAYEIEELSEQLTKAGNDSDSESELYAVRRMAVRMHELSGLIMRALSDRHATVDEMRFTLTGFRQDDETRPASNPRLPDLKRVK